MNGNEEQEMCADLVKCDLFHFFIFVVQLENTFCRQHNHSILHFPMFVHLKQTIQKVKYNKSDETQRGPKIQQ